jgi:hypothetical protein
MCARLHLFAGISSTLIIWIESARALCLAPISRSKEKKKKNLRKKKLFEKTDEWMNELILTTRSDGISDRDVSIFSIHIMSASSRVVSQPNSVVLHSVRGFVFLNLLYVNNFSVGFLHFSQSSGEVPEPWFSHYMVGRVDCHPIQRRIWVCLIGYSATDNSVLT